ncbi:hypothetical protein CHS0354_031851 [Potamilus streckersoni]|uniref:Uncharacterized protein n=1 Tax=Potamilus streckersoni TaxID=2493646 RepID=A0AAE0RXH5_9BIVA|nr:hypothetical protein CHS0354_031851 [Potamilus streckersoni]
MEGIIVAIKKTKRGKAPGPDNIPPEAPKANPQMTAEIIFDLVQAAREQRKICEEWSIWYIEELQKKGNPMDCKPASLTVQQSLYSAYIRKDSEGNGDGWATPGEKAAVASRKRPRVESQGKGNRGRHATYGDEHSMPSLKPRNYRVQKQRNWHRRGTDGGQRWTPYVPTRHEEH